MANNDTTKTITVTNKFGGGSTVGRIPAAVNMKVMSGQDTRWIVGFNADNTVVNLALASGGAIKAQSYCNLLTIDAPQASGFGWPTGSGCTSFGHSSVHSSGVDNTNVMSYLKPGGGTATFLRTNPNS